MKKKIIKYIERNPITFTAIGAFIFLMAYGTSLHFVLKRWNRWNPEQDMVIWDYVGAMALALFMLVCYSGVGMFILMLFCMMGVIALMPLFDWLKED